MPGVRLGAPVRRSPPVAIGASRAGGYCLERRLLVNAPPLVPRHAARSEAGRACRGAREMGRTAMTETILTETII